MANANSTAEQSEPIHLSAAAAMLTAAERPTNIEPFGDPRVFVVAYNDPRVAWPFKSHCRLEQDTDGPTFLIIGPLATDDQLLQAAKRFDLSFEDLVDFREELCEGAEDDAEEPAMVEVLLTNNQIITVQNALQNMLIMLNDDRDYIDDQDYQQGIDEGHRIASKTLAVFEGVPGYVYVDYTAQPYWRPVLFEHADGKPGAVTLGQETPLPGDLMIKADAWDAARKESEARGGLGFAVRWEGEPRH